MVTETAVAITPVQSGVNRLVDLLNADAGLLEDAAWFAETQLRDEGYTNAEIGDLKENHELRENTPIYDAYYRALHLFQKRVVQATTAIL